MKVRWRNKSFRMRISPSELAALEKGTSARESLDLPGGRLSVTICVGDKTQICSEGGEVTAQLSRADVDALAVPTVEGVYFRTDGESSLDWFVEKDFPCAHPRPPGVREAPEETFEPPPRFAERHGTNGSSGSDKKGCA